MSTMEYSIPTPSDSQSDWSGSNRGSSFSDSMMSPMFEGGDMDSSPIPTTLAAPLHQIHPESLCAASCPTGATMAMGASREGNSKPANTRQRRYAGEDDWLRNRDRIISLYEKKPLRDVIATMVKECNFHATERMYKARFKDWGVKKNVTAAEVHKLTQEVEKLQHRAGAYQTISSGESERVVVNVGGQNVRRIQKYIKRKPKGLEVLRRDPHRPLEVLKALSVDDGVRAGEVSIATAKLEERGQAHDGTLPSPPLDPFLSWSPEPQLPAHVAQQQQHYAAQQQQFFMGNGFDGTDPSAYLSPAPFARPLPPQWQNHGHGHGSAVGSTTPIMVQTDLSLADLSFSPGGLLYGYDENLDWQQAPNPSNWFPDLARPPPMGSSLGNTFGLMYGHANVY